MPRLYTKQEVAKLCHVSLRTVHRAIQDGQLETVATGRSKYFVRIKEDPARFEMLWSGSKKYSGEPLRMEESNAE